MKNLKSSPVDPIPAAFRAAHIIAARGEDVGDLDGLPRGEVVWREDGDTVTLTLDGWLVWVSGGAATFGRRVRATPALLAELSGEPK